MAIIRLQIKIAAGLHPPRALLNRPTYGPGFPSKKKTYGPGHSKLRLDCGKSSPVARLQIVSKFGAPGVSETLTATLRINTVYLPLYRTRAIHLLLAVS